MLEYLAELESVAPYVFPVLFYSLLAVAFAEGGIRKLTKWLASWRERRRVRQEKQRWMGALLRGLAQGAEEERRRKDYLAGYDEAAGFWAHLFCGSATQLERAIEESKKYRELHLVRHEWGIAGDGENDEANT